jgi:hypothetical protein
VTPIERLAYRLGKGGEHGFLTMSVSDMRTIYAQAASGMSAGTAETQSGSGLQPASPTAKPGRPEATAHPPQPK